MPALIARLDGELAQVLAGAELNATLVQQGYIVTHGDPAKLGAVTQAERGKWGRVIQAANVTLG